MSVKLHSNLISGAADGLIYARNGPLQQVTQDPTSGWLESTNFIVDARHYIGHRATGILCQLWCNLAPTNGSQPDLVLTEVDNDRNSHATCAFNTETADS